MKNDKILYLCIACFGIVGIYCTFISGNTSKYDSEATAYDIYLGERTDSDGSMYYPTYYFKVNGKDYQCETKSGSSSIPNENENKVYYHSSNPEKCITQYEKSSNTFVGIMCLGVTLLLIIILFKKPSANISESNQIETIDLEKQEQINENIQKASLIITKFQLIYKRIILGIIIIILLVVLLIDTAIIKQTIIAKNYVETTASYVDTKYDSESTIFDECIYTFVDKKGIKQEIIVFVSKDMNPESEIKIKYDENNPQEYYEDGSTYGKSGIIWYIVKIIAMILLIILFFNKKLLSKINLSVNRK